jgi:hypothetical protein
MYGQVVGETLQSSVESVVDVNRHDDAGCDESRQLHHNDNNKRVRAVKQMDAVLSTKRMLTCLFLFPFSPRLFVMIITIALFHLDPFASSACLCLCWYQQRRQQSFVRSIDWSASC